MKCSVIIPAYNIRDYIGRCLDSVLAQTMTDFEVIVIDDGSTDGTAEVLDAYAKENRQILVVHKENGGVSKARNMGIMLSQGKYLFFFDGDDFMEPETLEELVQEAVRQNADTVIYGYHRYEDQKVKESCLPGFDQDLYEGNTVISEVMPRFIGLSYQRIEDWLNHREGALCVENPALWRTMCSAKVIKENHLSFREELSVGEDTLFISEYLTYAQRVAIQRKCYYYLVTRETSTIYQYEKSPEKKLDQKSKQLQARVELTRDVWKRCKKNIDATWRGTIVMSAVEMGFLMARKNGDRSRKARYQSFLQYVKLPEVEKSCAHFHPNGGSVVKRIPFLLLRKHCYRMLFTACEMLHLIGYQFSR